MRWLLVAGLAAATGLAAVADEPAEVQREGRPAVAATSGDFDVLERVLDGTRTDFDFVGVPLSEALEILADRHRIRLFVDRVAIADEGFSAGKLFVDLTIEDVTLRHGLELLFHTIEDDIGLTIINDRGVLRVTTPQASYDLPLTRVYDTRRLTRQVAPSALIDALAISTGEFTVDLGAGNTILEIGGVLVVRARYEVQHAVSVRLGELTAICESPDGLNPPEPATGLEGYTAQPGAMYFVPTAFRREDGWEGVRGRFVPELGDDEQAESDAAIEGQLLPTRPGNVPGGGDGF
ncbi:MAG: hypothetical protein AAGJ97_14545, partial [Planctomycetota bacterium]